MLSPLRLISLFVVVTSTAGCLVLDDGAYQFHCAGPSCQVDTLEPDAGTTAPRDAGVSSECTISCMPPAATCTSARVLVSSRVRACSGNTCQYESTSTTCSQGCSNGGCVNEPCAGVSCDSPPAARCVDTKTLQVFVSSGVCNGGTCGYRSRQVTCSGTCSNDVCTDDPCAGRVCNLPPAAVCIGSKLRVYQSAGSCNGDSGSCSYAFADRTCANGCVNGTCKADACSGVTCNSPPVATCDTSTSRSYFDPTGTCGAGACQYTSKIEDCAPSGKVCQNGECVSATAACSAANCAGCCLDDQCIRPSEQSSLSCGSAGAACVACSNGFTCASGVCTDIDECEKNNGGCDLNALCSNGLGGRVCTCNAGYTGDGLTCVRSADAGIELQWRRLKDAGIADQPAPRRGAMMAYDEVQQETVLFGGYDGVSSHFDDTWVFSSNDEWYQLVAPGPEARRLGTVAYDANRRKTVLFGGFDGTTVYGDTWEWNGATWTHLAPTTPPPARYGAAMVYLPTAKKILMFGGQNDLDTELGDSWLFDGSTWSPLTGAGPSARFGPAMAYDAQRNKVVLFGGTADSAPMSDTYEFTITAGWVARNVLGPSERYGMVFGMVSNRMVIVGGYDYTEYLADTWEYDGTSWSKVSLSFAPAGRFFATSSVDTKRNRLLLFGGAVGSSTNALDDTWALGAR